MAATLWGKVYFDDTFVGLLEQQPGDRYAFTYDASYISDGHPAIAHTMPVREAPYLNEGRLHSFFDNLVAEGWLRNAQARALGVSREDRFALLLAFGRDCAGAVSIIDPGPITQPDLEIGDVESIAALTSRASLSGVQAKILAVKDPGGYRPAGPDETSTHIAKLPSGAHPDIIEVEWLTTIATRALLPKDNIVEMEITELGDTAPKALLIKRFDRLPNGKKRHFEEFNQLLGKPSGDDKYEGAYEDMAHFIHKTRSCIPAEAEQLFRRILTCILTGNTDAHLKNFAMLHTADGLRLAPAYDLVASSLYPDYQTLALSIGQARELEITKVQPKHIVALGEGYSLGRAAIELAINDLGKRLEAAKEALNEDSHASAAQRDKLTERMEKRWNGSFGSIGKLLSKRHGNEGNRKDFRNGDLRPSLR